MAYKYLTAEKAIQLSPKQDYINSLQQLMTEQFYNSSDWFQIQEETFLGSGIYQNVDARVVSVVNTTTGEKLFDDFKSFFFADLNHDVSLGKMYQFNSSYWLDVNIDKIKTTANSAIVKRCNNSLRWIDERTGAYYEVPCSLAPLIKLNKDYKTGGSELVLPSGTLQCEVQFNSKTNHIRPNQRFLFGNQNNYTSYRVQGGGINNFDNLSTMDNMSAGLLKLTLDADFTSYDGDDLINGVANAYTNVYSLTLNQSTISGNASQTTQLLATVTLNNATVTRTLTWSSSDITKATVSSMGLVTFVSAGTCTITCSMTDNASVFGTCSVTVGSIPIDNYQVVINPDSNYILEGAEKTWTVNLYKNGAVQGDTFVFTLDPNTVPTANYVYTSLTGNTFKVKNVKKFLTDVLEVTATDGAYSRIITINLRGAW